MYLMAEELLGGGGADVGDGHPFAAGAEATPGDKRVYVRVEVELVSERLDHRDHAGGQAQLLAGCRGTASFAGEGEQKLGGAAGQRIRAKPRSKMPQSRYRATTPSRMPRQKP
jgi:hypothetical protein